VVNVSGRGDKDLETVIEETSKRDLDIAPDMSILNSVGQSSMQATPNDEGGSH
jgi:tryptophan synthase beta chain